MFFELAANPVRRTFPVNLGWGVVCLFSLSLWIMGLAGIGVAADLDLPKAMQGVGIEQKLGHQVPEHLVFTNAQGQSTSLSKLLKAGKPV